MLCLHKDDIKLVWLCYKQPYRMRKMNELDHIQIVKVDIQFRVPIMNQLLDLRSCEFVNTPNKSIHQSREGALIIQTSTNLWWSNNSTGYYESISYGNMSKVNM